MTAPQGSGGEDLFPSPACDWITAYCDGGSRGNPGPAGFGVCIEDSAGRVMAELSHYLGLRTNNFAEYSGLLAALEFAATNGHSCLRVISDSELMVKQMKGQYRVKSPDLRPLYEQARRLTLKLDRFEIRHVLREKNRHADRLANLAMDRKTNKDSKPQIPAPETTAPEQRMLRGIVKGGVVHLLGSELADGIFVKVIPE